MAEGQADKKVQVSFEVDEIVKVKGILFKVVMMDYMTGHLGLRAMPKHEVDYVQQTVKTETQVSK